MASRKSRRPNGFIICALLAATAVLVSSGSRSGSVDAWTIGPERIVAWEALPPENGAFCEIPTAYAGEVGSSAGSQGGAPQTEASRSAVEQRKPIRSITDEYFAFAGIAVDTARNEVVIADENLSSLVVYDRLANTQPSAITAPKRVIRGERTFLEYAAAVYIDPGTGDLYGINNDTMNWMPVFGREQNGNVPAKRLLATPHTTFGIAVDEAAREMFLTIQDDHAVAVFDKYATDPEKNPAHERRQPPPGVTPPGPLRILQGSRTQMADPHGIVLDPRRGEIFVTNWGTGNERPSIEEARKAGLKNRGRTDLPVARHHAYPGSGKVQLASITVFAKGAAGDTAPVRVIQGPRTQLNWPSGMAVHPERGELFVANDVGQSVLVFRADAQGDVAPLRVLAGPRTQIKNPTGVAVDLARNELWVANLGNHSATVYRLDAAGDTAPLRVIRSAPVGTPSPMLFNPHTVAFDSKRDEILAANCVGHPAVVAYPRLAKGNVVPLRKIAGGNTLIARTIHDMAYDPVRDEIVVPAFYAYAILTFRGDADGDVAPVRKIFGPRTQLLNPEALAIDAIHGEIFVPQDERVLVFPMEADGDVAPIRILAGPDTGLNLGRVTVDPVNNLLIAAGAGGLRIFDRTASGNTKPRAFIRGGGGLMTTYPPKGLIFAKGGDGGTRHEAGEYIGVWSIHDNGNVPPKWTIGNGVFYDIRGVAIDPKSQTVIVSDKTLNAVVSFHVPEIFRDEPSTR